MSHSRVSAQTKKAFKDYFALVDLNNPDVDKLHDDLTSLIPSKIQDTTGRAWQMMAQLPFDRALRILKVC